MVLKKENMQHQWHFFPVCYTSSAAAVVCIFIITTAIVVSQFNWKPENRDSVENDIHGI